MKSINQKSKTEILNRFLIRLLLISANVFSFRNIESIREYSYNFFNAVIPLASFFHYFKRNKIVQHSLNNSYFVIIFGIFVLLPIFQTLMIEISSDTIYLYFVISQILFCLGSMRTSLMNMKTGKREYNRNETIPLDESLLLTKEFPKNSDYGNIASSLGFLLLFSRVNDSINSLYLLIIGFIMHYYIPEALDMSRIYRKSKLIVLFVIFYSLFLIIIDTDCFLIFACILLTSYFPFKIVIKIIENNKHVIMKS